MTITMNVFINGTDETADDLSSYEGITSLANVLHALAIKNDKTVNYCLDGCGINNQHPLDLGAIFTFNLEKQVNDIVKKVKSIIDENGKVHLNLYGFSRGGAAVLWICKKLKDISNDKLSINASAFEPVPGNFIRGAYADKLTGTCATLASQIADLSDCNNINRIQVLFTADPLPDIACHGPILPILPKNTFTQADVTSGCHKSAERFIVTAHSVRPSNKHSLIAFHQIVDFLEESGLEFDFSQLALSTKLRDRSTQNKLSILKQITVEPSHRAMHFYNEIKVKDFSINGVQYVNLYHQSLEGKEHDMSQCALVLKEYNPAPTYSNGLKSFGLFTTSTVAAASTAVLYSASSSYNK
ncbi:hypothetical protein ACQUW5_14230 [Legionella sp. CNM-1927-20]|uniref:hypothetical protein n=1 Tax=Legionella sp. CNM-1927-20 TaxID=3422221 RepID=UPI00403AE8FF